MTNEEAIETVKELRDIQISADGKSYVTEALDLAIAALNGEFQCCVCGSINNERVCMIEPEGSE